MGIGGDDDRVTRGTRDFVRRHIEFSFNEETALIYLRPRSFFISVQSVFSSNLLLSEEVTSIWKGRSYVGIMNSLEINVYFVDGNKHTDTLQI
jgi:hypothetical protein